MNAHSFKPITHCDEKVTPTNRHYSLKSATYFPLSQPYIVIMKLYLYQSIFTHLSQPHTVIMKVYLYQSIFTPLSQPHTVMRKLYPLLFNVHSFSSTCSCRQHALYASFQYMCVCVYTHVCVHTYTHTHTLIYTSSC